METVIADADPLVAYHKRDDKDNDWATAVFQRLTGPVRSCDAALGEAGIPYRAAERPDCRLPHPTCPRILLP